MLNERRHREFLARLVLRGYFPGSNRSFRSKFMHRDGQRIMERVERYLRRLDRMSEKETPLAK